MSHLRSHRHLRACLHDFNWHVQRFQALQPEPTVAAPDTPVLAIMDGAVEAATVEPPAAEAAEAAETLYPLRADGVSWLVPRSWRRGGRSASERSAGDQPGPTRVRRSAAGPGPVPVFTAGAAGSGPGGAAGSGPGGAGPGGGAAAGAAGSGPGGGVAAGAAGPVCLCGGVAAGAAGPVATAAASDS